MATLGVNSVRVAVGFAAAIFIILLAASASLETVLFAQAFPYLLGLAAIAVAALLTIALRQGVHLWRQVRMGWFGSRLRAKLTGILLMMALFPTLVLYGVTVFFVVRAIDAWFDVRVERALDAAGQLARHAIDTQVARLLAEAQWLQSEWVPNAHSIQGATLEQWRQKMGLDGLLILTGKGVVQGFAGEDPQWVQQEAGTPAEWQLAKLQETSHRVVETEESSWVRVVVWIPQTIEQESAFMVLLRRVPTSIRTAIDEVTEARSEYAQITHGREALQRLYLVILSVAVVTAWIAAAMIALQISRHFITPLLALEEGTRALAEGRYVPVADRISSQDELGWVVRSFDRMSEQLAKAQAEQARAHAEVEAARAYLETVLAHLTTAVLVFDETHHLVLANAAAKALLGDESTTPLNANDAWRGNPALRDRLQAVMAVASGPVTFEWVDEDKGKTFVVHVAPLTEVTSGWVVVIDDVTDVVLAQRLAAWGEIARRLAHEIKNPLTPIRLAAERLRYKLAEKLPEKERQLLERATTTVIDQVEAMTEMVNAFRDYAKMPNAKKTRVDLAELIRSLFVFYEEGGIPVECVVEGEGPWAIEGDPGQLRQVLHNLLQNAQDALEGIADPRIVVRLVRQNDRIELSVQDNGIGFPEGYQQKAFEPYYTTKRKGTGLGLAVVKKIVDDHHAAIVLTTPADGKGAEVRLTFAAADREEGDDGKSSDRR